MPYPKPRPSKHRLKVKRGLAGLGLFTETPIKRKDFVIEYWGPLITDGEADKRGGRYLFNIADTTWTINGNVRQNLARYINHSCKPNCEAIQEGKRIFLYATRAIQPGEELSYDYGREYFTDVIGKQCRCGNHV